MFLGEYQTNFSGKGRVILPKKFRKELESSKELVLSRGFEGCIWGFTKEGFAKEATQQLEVSASDKKARDLRRYIFSTAEEVALDEQGRFVIPGPLLQYAKLSYDVVIIGTGDHIEIWQPNNWKKVLEGIETEKGK